MNMVAVFKPETLEKWRAKMEKVCNKQQGQWLDIVNVNIGSAFMSTSKLNDSILWHARLGHVHYKRMQDMSKDGLISTFDMDTEKWNKIYFVTFIDDASRFCYVYLLHTKDEALDKFKVFKTEVELQQGSLIKRFKTDWGGERGIKCIFIGYAKHSKAFRFYVIEPNESVLINSIIKSMNAIFDENIFSSVPRRSLRIPNGTEDIGGSVSDYSSDECEGNILECKFDESDKGVIEFLASKLSMKDMGEADVIIGKLSRYTSNPSTQHWQTIQRQLQYLKKTMDYSLIYIVYPSVLEGYVNASWISNTEDNSSTSGWVFLLGGGAISWASKNQTCITSSTIEYEFMTLAAAAKAYSQMYNGKSRHLGVRHSKIHELIMNGVVSIEFVRSQQNLADHLTKGLAKDLVLKSAEGMSLKSN
ncbi:zinc finger, CCHC-type containing protein [Tanacetum coccineum]